MRYQCGITNDTTYDFLSRLPTGHVEPNRRFRPKYPGSVFAVCQALACQVDSNAHLSHVVWGTREPDVMARVTNTGLQITPRMNFSYECSITTSAADHAAHELLLRVLHYN